MGSGFFCIAAAADFPGCRSFYADGEHPKPTNAARRPLRALGKRVGSVGRCSVWRDPSCGRFTDQELKRGDQE